jgi:hypothetical protein
MNLLAIRTLIQNQTSNDAYYTSTEIDEAINSAQLTFISDVKYNTTPESQNSIASIQEYTLSNLIEVVNVTYDGAILTNDSLENILIRMSGLTTANNTGTPKFFYIRNHNILGLLPIPDSVKVIKVFQKETPATLVTDVSIPEIPVQFHRSLAYLPLAEFCQKDKEFEQALYWRKLFEVDIEKAKAYLKNQARFIRQVREQDVY